MHGLDLLEPGHRVLHVVNGQEEMSSFVVGRVTSGSLLLLLIFVGFDSDQALGVEEGGTGGLVNTVVGQDQGQDALQDRYSVLAGAKVELKGGKIDVTIETGSMRSEL